MGCVGDDEYGRTARDLAVQKGHKTIVRALDAFAKAPKAKTPEQLEAESARAQEVAAAVKGPEAENGAPPDAMNEPSHEIDHPTSPGYMPPPTVIGLVIDPDVGCEGESILQTH